MGTLLDRVASPSALTDSWKRVLANDAADDMLSAGVQRFAKDADNRLNKLRERLLGGGYVPARLARVSIPKENGDTSGSCTSRQWSIGSSNVLC
ncbi:MAG: hypothetical protein ACRDTG_16245 [Pseudonocardiaceae bacterium]